MTEQELLTLLHWRWKRGYKGLTLRRDGIAWVVNYFKGETRTSKNFKFDPTYDASVLWQLDEACGFLEQVTTKNEKNYKMFGKTRISRVRREMCDGNDLEGVFLEKHANGVFRLQFQSNMPNNKYRFVVPKDIRDEARLAWILAFGRQARANSFFVDHRIIESRINEAWKQLIVALRDKHTLPLALDTLQKKCE